MSEWFFLSLAATDEDAAVSRLCKSLDKIKAGAYENGLLTVLSVADSTRMLEKWTDSIGQAICLVVTGLGDAFFWDVSKKAVYFLDSQYGTYTFIDSDIEWVFTQYLLMDGVKKSVLKSDIFSELTKRLGLPKFMEVFFPVPFRVLGGDGAIESFRKGAAQDYFSLLIQVIGNNNIRSTD